MRKGRTVPLTAFGNRSRSRCKGLYTIIPVLDMVSFRFL